MWWRFNKETLIQQITKIATFLVAFWLVFLLGRSVWQNWVLRRDIWQQNEQIAFLEKQKKDLNNLILYYQSDSFRELEARKRLGLKKVGEKMVILATSLEVSRTNEPTNFPEEVTQEKEKITTPVVPSKIANWLYWWQYFTK